LFLMLAAPACSSADDPAGGAADATAGDGAGVTPDGFTPSADKGGPTLPDVSNVKPDYGFPTADPGRPPNIAKDPGLNLHELSSNPDTGEATEDPGRFVPFDFGWQDEGSAVTDDPDTTTTPPEDTYVDPDAPCVPDCTGRVCGDDGCGGSCGECENAEDVCDLDGQCVPYSVPCSSVDDCPNPLELVCDPTTAMCILGSESCDGFFTPCPEGQVCLGQADGAWYGACYEDCLPFLPSSCPAGHECVQIDFSGQMGVCQRATNATAGSVCEPSDISTMCGVGLVCTPQGENAPPVCRAMCHTFAAEPGCVEGLVCHLGGTCGPPAIAEEAKIGEPCSGPESEFGSLCGMTAKAVKGVCVEQKETLVCTALCRLDGLHDDCEAGQICADAFGLDVGICVSTGGECQSATDCPAPSAMMCDPDTATCEVSECDGWMTTCPEGQQCQTMSDVSNAGACYTSCIAADPASCPEGFTCETTDLTGSAGICRRVGPAGTGDPCELSDISTGCKPGLSCLADPEPVCRESCDFFAPEPGCSEGLICALGGICLKELPFDPSALGEPCNPEEARYGQTCGSDGKAVRGFCDELEDGTLICTKLCRPTVAEDCAEGEVCNAFYFDPAMGSCVKAEPEEPTDPTDPTDPEDPENPTE